MPKLSVVATPIGNLQDITLRALDVLSESDFILCEDTRVTKKLLDYYNIQTKTVSYHQRSGDKKVHYIIDLLKQGKNLSLVSDAGTPGISDPGGKLVEAIVKELGDEARIEAIPGPSAVIAGLSVSGMPTDKFLFLGYPPHKKGRQKFIYSIFTSDYTVAIYESKHRIMKFLEEMEQAKEVVEKELGRQIVVKMTVCRELTKMHETVYRGEVEKIKKTILEKGEEAKKGEFVIIINVRKKQE
jgi:16S rRNA (cytidine1402-2'-O)-methyltransferase